MLILIDTIEFSDTSKSLNTIASHIKLHNAGGRRLYSNTAMTNTSVKFNM